MDTIAFIAAAVIALVAGGYGLGKVMFERGYVRGYEAATHQNGDITFTPD